MTDNQMIEEEFLTPACEDGRHDVCRCLLPGQNRAWAGVIGDDNGDFWGFCACACHEGDLESELAVLFVEAR